MENAAKCQIHVKRHKVPLTCTIVSFLAYNQQVMQTEKRIQLYTWY